MNARVAAPKPTTAFFLSEIQVVGISRSPRGYAAIVEATPIKLAYVIYPGERFYDGQLVAIEDNSSRFPSRNSFHGRQARTFSRNETSETGRRRSTPSRRAQSRRSATAQLQRRRRNRNKPAADKP